MHPSHRAILTRIAASRVRGSARFHLLGQRAKSPGRAASRDHAYLNRGLTPLHLFGEANPDASQAYRGFPVTRPSACGHEMT